MWHRQHFVLITFSLRYPFFSCTSKLTVSHAFHKIAFCLIFKYFENLNNAIPFLIAQFFDVLVLYLFLLCLCYLNVSVNFAVQLLSFFSIFDIYTRYTWCKYTGSLFLFS